MMGAIREIYAKAAINLRRIEYKKRLGARIITKGDFPLRPGLWLVGPEFSRNVAVLSLPAPLDGVKRWGDWRQDKTLKVLVRLSEALIYPWLVKARRVSTAPFVADVILVNRLNEPVGFDLKKQKVIKSLTSAQIDLLEKGVSHLADVYPCVPFRINHQTGYVFEDMISGSAFSVASGNARIAGVGQFFKGLQRAPSLDLKSKARTSWRAACQKLLSQMPRSNVPQLQIEKYVIEIIANAKVSWVHGDLFGENIIVSNREMVVIDYDKSGLAPTFTDIMTLFVFEARTLRFDLMDIYFQGGFDKEFSCMGCHLDGDNEFLKKVSTFIAWLGWKMTSEEFSSINIRRFFDILTLYLDKNSQKNTSPDSSRESLE